MCELVLVNWSTIAGKVGHAYIEPLSLGLLTPHVKRDTVTNSIAT